MYLSSATKTSPHSAEVLPISAPPDASGRREVLAVTVVPLTVPPSKLATIVPVADKVMKNGFLLGAHHGMTIEDVEHVCGLIKIFFNK